MEVERCVPERKGSSSDRRALSSVARYAVHSRNVIVDSDWMFLLQTNNTLFESIRYEHGTVVCIAAHAYWEASGWEAEEVDGERLGNPRALLAG